MDMMTRKAFIGSAAVLTAGSLAYGFGSSRSRNETYEAATNKIWRHTDTSVASDAC